MLTARGEPRPHRVEAGQLLGRVGIVGLVGDREVGPQPFETQLTVGVDELGERVGGLGCRADAVHPGVDLEVHRKRARVGRDDRLRQRLDARGGVHGGREPASTTVVAADGHRLGQHEDRRVDAGLAQLDALFDERDAEHRRAGFDRGPPGRDGAVAVAVGLHDREHPRRRDDPRAARRRWPERREIDLRPHRAQLSSFGGGRWRRSLSCVRSSGR